jgi:outer membrane lipoprotein SlyB
MSKTNPENLDPITKTPGAHPLGTGLGAAGGAAAGAAVGSTAGPLGTLAGGVVGAIAGGLAGKEIAENANPTEGSEAGERELGDVAVTAGEANDGAAELVNPHLANAIADHHLAEGLGAGGGAVLGAAAGTPGGPLGMVAGAAVGAVAGGAIGKGRRRSSTRRTRISTGATPTASGRTTTARSSTTTTGRRTSSAIARVPRCPKERSTRRSAGSARTGR